MPFFYWRQGEELLLCAVLEYPISSQVAMSYFVYVLFSNKLQKFYTGTTDNVVRRLEEHNAGFYPEAFSKKGIPWDLYLSIECSSSEQAYRLEAFIKKMKSADFIKRLKQSPDLAGANLEKIRGEMDGPRPWERRN